MNIHKTTSAAFYEHFENFSLVAGEANFVKDLQHNMNSMIKHSKNIKKPGIELICSIY